MRARTTATALVTTLTAAVAVVASPPASAAPLATALERPAGVAAAADGSVYVTTGDRVVRYPGGATVAAGLASPRGIAVGPDGMVYVAEAGAGRVVALDRGPVLDGLARPTGVAVDALGTLVVAEAGAGRVRIGNAVVGGFSTPTGVAIEGDGSVLVADAGGALVRLRAGERTVVAGGGTAPSACAGEAGPARTASTSPPTGVAVGGDGTVYVTDPGHRRVAAVSPDGTLTTVAGGVDGLVFPSALAVDRDGRLVVADSGAGVVVVPDPVPPVDRVSGADRHATAAALSARFFPTGVPLALLATGSGFADALAAAGAAAPVLLTGRDALPAATRSELDRLRPGRVLVVGGRHAVGDAVLAQVGGERVAGADRYETAAALSAALFPAGVASAVVVSGESFPDALSGGALASLTGAPVLLARRDGLPPATAAELERLSPAKVVVVGGNAAVGEGVEGERVAGADRYETAAAVTGRVATASTVLVATGNGFPDGLAAAAAARQAGGPVLLVPCFDLPEPVRAARERLAGAPLVVVGGPAAVPDLVPGRMG